MTYDGTINMEEELDFLIQAQERIILTEEFLRLIHNGSEHTDKAISFCRRHASRINFEYRDANQFTPLFAACNELDSQYPLVKELVEHGADIEATLKTSYNIKPISVAAFQCNQQIFKYLLEIGAQRFNGDRLFNYVLPSFTMSVQTLTNGFRNKRSHSFSNALDILDLFDSVEDIKKLCTAIEEHSDISKDSTDNYYLKLMSHIQHKLITIEKDTLQSVIPPLPTRPRVEQSAHTKNSNITALERKTIKI